MASSKRKRSYIPYPERLAAALVCFLTQEHRDELRRNRVPAKVIISLFTNDHIVLHALGGSDKWWNLDPRIRGEELKKKDNRDTSIVAKVRRIIANPDKWRAITKSKRRPRRAKRAWPKRKFTNLSVRPL